MRSSDQPVSASNLTGETLDHSARVRARITIPEIAASLQIGRMMVYEMLERRLIPGIRVGRRYIVTRYAYEHWERTCGAAAVAPASDPHAQ